MIVRLKEDRFQKLFIHLYQFQFYDSPIKRKLKLYKISVFCAFQFYDSPIKSLKMDSLFEYALFSFNSMIVRLKDERFSKLFSCKVRFNSMIVRLKVLLK